MNEKLWQAIVKGLESISAYNPYLVVSLGNKQYISEALPAAADFIYLVLNELSEKETNEHLQSLESLIVSLLKDQDLLRDPDVFQNEGDANSMSYYWDDELNGWLHIPYI